MSPRTSLRISATMPWRIASPTGWPKRSLMDLKSSMSSISTARGLPTRSARPSSRWRTSWKWRWLYAPVSESRIDCSRASAY